MLSETNAGIKWRFPENIISGRIRAFEHKNGNGQFPMILARAVKTR
jgi:hypothetical protein